MRISDWSSDVCSSDRWRCDEGRGPAGHGLCRAASTLRLDRAGRGVSDGARSEKREKVKSRRALLFHSFLTRSEEHTSELQSLMRISYAVFCLKKKNINNKTNMNQLVINTHI